MSSWIRVATGALAGIVLLPAAGCDLGEEEPRIRITLLGRTLDGGTPPAEAELAAAGEVVAGRFAAAGLPAAEATVEDGWLVLLVDGQVDEDKVTDLVARSLVQFRKVLAQAPVPAGSGGPTTTDGYLGDHLRADVHEAVGEDAWDAAVALAHAPEDLPPDLVDRAAPFTDLSGGQVAALPPGLQFAAPIGCDQLAARPVGATADPGRPAVACDPYLGVRYLLDTAALDNAGIARASAQTAGGGPPTVNIGFTPEGQAAWTDLTREAVGNQAAAPYDPALLADRDRYGGDTPVGCGPSALGSGGNCLAALVLDDRVLSAPVIVSVINGDANIAGNFTPAESRLLAGRIGSDPLPLLLEVVSIELA